MHYAVFLVSCAHLTCSNEHPLQLIPIPTRIVIIPAASHVSWWAKLKTQSTCHINLRNVWGHTDAHIDLFHTSDKWAYKLPCSVATSRTLAPNDITSLGFFFCTVRRSEDVLSTCSALAPWRVSCVPFQKCSQNKWPLKVWLSGLKAVGFVCKCLEMFQQSIISIFKPELFAICNTWMSNLM